MITEHFHGHDLDDVRIHDRDMRNINRANVLVGDVTAASTGLGYEIGRVVERNQWVEPDKIKPILCLHKPPREKISAMITGCQDGIVSREYKSREDAYSHIDAFFESLQD